MTFILDSLDISTMLCFSRNFKISCLILIRIASDIFYLRQKSRPSKITDIYVGWKHQRTHYKKVAWQRWEPRKTILLQVLWISQGYDNRMKYLQYTLNSGFEQAWAIVAFCILQICYCIWTALFASSFSTHQWTPI